jgi:hypothetical protein
MYRLVNQQDGNVDCDINVDGVLSAALEALDYLGYDLKTTDDIVVFPAKHKVVIEVEGGCAGVTSCPDGVEVEIIDHDNDGR